MYSACGKSLGCGSFTQVCMQAKICNCEDCPHCKLVDNYAARNGAENKCLFGQEAIRGA